MVRHHKGLARHAAGHGKASEHRDVQRICRAHGTTSFQTNLHRTIAEQRRHSRAWVAFQQQRLKSHINSNTVRVPRQGMSPKMCSCNQRRTAGCYTKDANCEDNEETEGGLK